MATKTKATKGATAPAKAAVTKKAETKPQRVGRFRVLSKPFADRIAAALAAEGFVVTVVESKKKRNDDLNFAGSIRIK